MTVGLAAFDVRLDRRVMRAGAESANCQILDMRHVTQSCQLL
jgi:hypothetical protein